NRGRKVERTRLTKAETWFLFWILLLLSLLCLKTDLPSWWYGLRLQFFKLIEDNCKILIVLCKFSDDGGKFPVQFLIGFHHFAQLNKGTHDGDIDLNCALASQNTG